MKRVGVNILIVIMILVGSLLPFNIKTISANGTTNVDVIKGVNVSMWDYEERYVLSTLNFDIQPSYNGNETDVSQWRCDNMTANGCMIYSNKSAEGYRFTYAFDSDTMNYSYTNKNVFEYDFIFDNYYIGYIDINLSHTGNQNTRWYVNGTHLSIKSSNILYTNFNITNYSLTKVDWNSVPQNIIDIENYLKSINTNTDEVEDILRGIRNIDTQLLSKMQYFFPIESYTWVSQCFSKNYENVGITNTLNNYTYPIFLTDNTKSMLDYSMLNNGKYCIIFYMHSGSITSINTFNNFFTYNGTCTKINSIHRIGGLRCTYAEIENNTGASININLTPKTSNIKFIPIYINNVQDIHPISTDFALTYNLNNKLLYNLDLIANGNTTSNNTVSNADNTNQQAQQIFNQEEQLISNAEDDLQDKLNDLDIANKNNNLFGNSKFIASANWVKQQFDFMTNNNAYNYMITFSLVIGISLVIIGKLRG